MLEVGQNAQKLVAEATASAPPCYVHAGPIDVVLANRISKHALCDVGLVGDTGIHISQLPQSSSLQSTNKLLQRMFA